MLAAIYDDTGRILQMMQGDEDSIRATATHMQCELLELPVGTSIADLDATHRVIGGELAVIGEN